MIFRRITLPSQAIPGKPLRQFDHDLMLALDGMVTNLMGLFDKGINIDDNLDVKEVAITTNGVADTEDGFAHTLKRVPKGYIVVKRDKAGTIYDGASAWTSTTIYLRSNVATVAATILVY